uniref:Aquaporin-3 n=1 Tax=Salarias fasciatus TaxID=181472 RepID=A0A672IMB4_SALFA
MGRQKQISEKLAATFRIRRALLQQALAECLGTLILVMFGCGAVAQTLLSSGTQCTFLTINFAFGLAVTLGVATSGQVSGGHLNPAVTFTLRLLGREPWKKFPLFFVFQSLGAFLGAVVVFGMYFGIRFLLRPSQLANATAGIFATYPAKHLTLINGFFDQIIGTAALILCILAIVEEHSRPVPPGLQAFTVLVVGLSMGYNAGYAVNPARDLGPRLFTAFAGWGLEVFTANTYWFLVPTCAPFLGAVVGVLVYQLMIGCHRAEVKEMSKEEEERLRLATLEDS